ncbi:gliding motility-associated C-terminal domain-containing protein [Lutibacter agarilyticus]|uniref:Gliding motility-associated C-terminal domain-containing protein n=1 Tax=Lutibacter agarilyticus TaxID=1109740 RepID=A0A238W6H3_9FLAO|nr:T9SS type B sorting domain-containing protein [Lutibacter agarilyticus]SNR42027.1 gliding motility-associated C-terminal domain-containing protein [Lutibacter agarilyticus]
MKSKPNNAHISLILLLLIAINCWSQQPPELTATGNQAYCPLRDIPIVTDFNITNPDNVPINNIYIQISEGYERGEDSLILTGSHPNITEGVFNNTEGKLKLEWTGSGTPNDSELIAAVKDVQFRNNTVNPSSDKAFSITAGEANYLPSTDHYYEYVSDIGITWKNAKIAAEARTYYDRQGYLATITSIEEAILSGDQAAGAGWIGGSDEAVEGTWRWVTGPETGKSFWFGDGNGTTVGTDIPFAYWNTSNNEPNNLGDEDFAHVTAPGIGDPGSWNDLSNTGESSGDYQPKGYIVEYGAPGDPPLNISTSTKIYIPRITATTTPTPICGAGTATLTATSNTSFVIWYDALTGGTNLRSGDTYTIPSPISTTTTYYALASSDGICETGERTPITVVVNTIPTITSTTNTTICGAGTGTLTATASAGTINWYDMPTGGILMGTGTSFTAPVIFSTTTYYADATENSCTTLTRTPATITVQYTTEPLATSPQTFCDIENATLADLTITGTTILWYANATGGTAINPSELLVNNTTYYATQTINGCESPTRLAINVSVFETVVELPSANIPILEECDNSIDGDDTNGFTLFNLTDNEAVLLNGKNASDFTFSYFTDPTYVISSEITNPTNFENTVVNGQTIYVRIANNIDNSCTTETSFEIQVNSLPVIQYNVTLKNCDEDGTPDGFTDFNLTEADPFITNGDTTLTVTYYLNFADADSGNNAINPSPFNNATANTVYARAENLNGCHRVATITLEVSTTSFPTGYMNNLEQCDADDSIDGFEIFDLTQASADIINQFPTGQNLSVHYFRNLNDAQLKKNEILPQDSYINETPFLQVLYVRVQSEDNGDCFGVGAHVTLTVYTRPEFEVNPAEIVCLNLPPITLAPSNAQGIYTYEWFNEAGTLISSQPTASVTEGGIYTVIATSSSGCASFPKTVTVTESIIATITQNDISVTDDSENNTITINTVNLGIGEYEFSLDNSNGPYQDEPIFEMVAPGIHTIFIQDKNNCGIASIEVSVIGFPNFFTPNNDGFNDTWQILGVSSDFYPTSLIYIFDRYGKLITQIRPTSEGWNGWYNNEQLPATDYWFTAQLIDEDGNIRVKKGHFSLIR